ncbi:selenoneine biosynthesis selenosugar synthase SenB [Ramlibacter sp. PS3R-8]|uniref:selenoneine biosynthesis selenosugar synthase SenB n=1 Tax=Ramlibacter sp. PS3R-8 TaxID=3133437 RepID=UPI0030AE54D7
MSRPLVVIVSPALADANNGNWRTAQRWAELLAPRYATRIAREWPAAAPASDTLMLALHARRSAAAIAAWAAAHPGRGLAVVLTGTDLYQDIADDAAAQRSLVLAQRLVVLQECGAEALPRAHRDKTRVIYPSTAAWPALPKSPGTLDAVMVGHLRAVKAPHTLFDAARRVPGSAGIRITHVGDGTAEPGLAAQALATQHDCPGYRWLGALPHQETLQAIRAAHVLVHTSTLEGGAHVIMEAVRCGTPVLASRVPGNVGMLGASYEGYFPAGDGAALARQLMACRQRQQEDPAGGLLARLRAQCAVRALLFDPEHERAALLSLLQELESDR